MANPKWTVSIVFQNSNPDDPSLFASLREDIELQEKINPGAVKYFVLRQDEENNEAIAFTINNQGKLEEVVGNYSIKGFYKEWEVPKIVWTNFFKLASTNSNTKHFVMTHGHGAGYGFSTNLRKDKDNTGNKSFNLLRILLSQSSFTSEFSTELNRNLKNDINTKFNIENSNVLHDGADDYLGIVPVGVFKAAIEEAYKGQKILFLYFGNCFMQTIENGYLFKDHVQYMAATEGYYEPTGTNFQALFEIMANEINESLLYKKIADAICDGIPYKTKDQRMETLYGLKELERIRNGFSFSVNDLSKYKDLKHAISAFGQSLIESSKNYPKVREGINITREDPRICKDVWQDQKLGITDLLRFCKNLCLDKEYLKAEDKLVYNCMLKINEFFSHDIHGIIVARYFPFKAFEPTDRDATSVYPEGASIFFPRKKIDALNETEEEIEKDIEEYLGLYMNKFYRNNIFNHPFLDENQWRDFVIKYYDRLL